MGHHCRLQYFRHAQHYNHQGYDHPIGKTNIAAHFLQHENRHFYFYTKIQNKQKINSRYKITIWLNKKNVLPDGVDVFTVVLEGIGCISLLQSSVSQTHSSTRYSWSWCNHLCSEQPIESLILQPLHQCSSETSSSTERSEQR